MRKMHKGGFERYERERCAKDEEREIKTERWGESGGMSEKEGKKTEKGWR